MRRQLRRTWTAFFSRYGQLTPVQSALIPRVLAGRSCVVCSPTASGKTEAAVAPLVERYLPAGTQTLTLLYIVPTRALVNDLLRRLEGPLSDLRLRIEGRTGERKSRSEDVAVCVTTPESLDSLLCRRPEWLSTVRAVILDELHLLHGTYRGDQLQILLRRLPAGLQCVALSATLAQPEVVLSQYFEDEGDVVEVGSPRTLSMEVVEDIPAAVEALKSVQRHKVLWFCNRRRDVEAVASALAEVWPKDRIVAHHGSLSRAERESAEQAMQQWTWGICVATMTLEVGIDIGSTDAVVLQGPPLSLSAFRQRVGRACRQHASVFALGVSLRKGDPLTFEAMAEAARDGEVEHANVEPDLSVAIQQTFSLLYAAPSGLEQSLVAHLLEPLAGERTLARIWEHLANEGWIEIVHGARLRATTKLMDAGERGRIHGNIPEPSELRFRDADTGKMLGSGLAGVSVGDVLVFGGRTRRVVSVEGGHVRMERAAGAAGLPRFSRRHSGGAWRWLIPSDLREGESSSS